MGKQTIKNLIKLLIVFAVFGFISSRVYAIDSYNKFSANPLLAPGDYIWNSRHNYAPSVIKNGSIYEMWYSAHNGNTYSIAYATSNDGLVWNKSPGLISISKGNWGSSVSAPTVIFDNGVYRMWYQIANDSAPNGTERYRIGYATSNDGLNWNVKTTNALGTTEIWNREGVAAPSVLKEQNYFFMWYSGRNTSGNWAIGQAYSTDGVNWTEHSHNPALRYDKQPQEWEHHQVSSPDVIYYQGNYIMFYHAGPNISNGINVGNAKSDNGIQWNKFENNPLLSFGISAEFDSYYIAAPSVVDVGGELWMYYSGYDGEKWSIGLATEGEPPVPDDKRDIVIIVPGMFASYDPVAFATCTKTPQSDWKLIPQVTEYDGLIATLESAGYEEGKDLFVFPYDWRQPIAGSGEELAEFVASKAPDNKQVDIVGHSLGGLVARSYLQEHGGAAKIDQLITVGSPHKGVGEAYKAWAGGELPEDGAMRVAASIITNICKIRTGSLTAKAAIRKSAPVFRDILPTSQYLKRAGTHLDILYSDMPSEFQNPYLASLNQTFSNYSGKFSGITSTSFNTPLYYGIASYIEDKLRGVYTFGRPTSVVATDPGDKTVLASSAKFSNISQSYTLPYDHRGIIYTSEAVKTITDILGLAPAKVTPGKRTIFTPSFVGLLGSPATLSITDPTGETEIEDKFFFIPNHSPGDYDIRVNGTGEGEYELSVGQLTQDEETWNSYAGETDLGKTDIYKINLDSDDPLLSNMDSLSVENVATSAAQKLAELRRIEDSEVLELSEEYLQKENPLYLLRILRYLGYYINDAESPEAINLAYELMRNIEENYYLGPDSETDPNIESRYYTDLLAKSLGRQALLRIDAPTATVSATVYKSAEEKLNKSQKLIAKNPLYADSLLHSARNLLSALISD